MQIAFKWVHDERQTMKKQIKIKHKRAHTQRINHQFNAFPMEISRARGLNGMCVTVAYTQQQHIYGELYSLFLTVSDSIR